MKDKLVEKGKEVADRNLSRLMKKFPHSKEQMMLIDLDEDARITKWFPLFLAICIVVWVAMMLAVNDFSISVILQTLCLSFILCFAVLGAILFKRMPQGPLSKWALVILAGLLAALVLVMGELMVNMRAIDLVTDLFSSMGIELASELAVVIVFLIMFATFLFTPTGVLTVTCAYLKKYMPRIFIGMRQNASEGVRGKSEGFFKVPSIIDVKEVRMEPKIDYENFDSSAALHLWVYTIIMGAVVASYLFLSPYFLDNMTTQEMLATLLMLSMFVPAMIIPWQIVRDLNALVISDAPRPYYLWNGAKDFLFGSFVTLGAFSMMFFLALYYGHSVGSMLVNYAYLIAPLIAISMMHAVMYANNFNNVMKAVIYARFSEEESGDE